MLQVIWAAIWSFQYPLNVNCKLLKLNAKQNSRSGFKEDYLEPEGLYIDKPLADDNWLREY